MSHSVVIEITIPLGNGNVLEHAEMLTNVKKPLEAFMGELGKGATQTVRIVKARTEAGQARGPRKPASRIFGPSALAAE